MNSILVQETDVDVIIVGAGISGMSAALYVLERDPSLTVLVLEAKDRIGGRTLSIPLKSSLEKACYRSFDIGAQFVSPSQNHLMRLVEKLDLHLSQSQDFNGYTVWNLSANSVILTTRSLVSLNCLREKVELVKFFEKIQNISEKVTFINPLSIPDYGYYDAMTMEEFLLKNLKHTVSQNFARHVVRMTCGVEPSEISVLFYLAFYNSSEDIENQFLLENINTRGTWIQEGAGEICQQIARIIGRQLIKTGDPVIEIEREPYYVFVETKNDMYLCKYVIVALPPSEILNIAFTPPLPHSRMELLRNIKSGHLTKFVITYRSPFWREKSCTGNVISCGKQGGYGPIHACYDITSDKSAALTGYITSTDCLKKPKGNFKKQVLLQLAHYFGEEALNPVDYFEKCWVAQPYNKSCSGNCPGVNRMDKYSELRRPIGRLFWAGTETATHWNGYMGGAVQAGYRAALEVLYEFRPQTLTVADIASIYPKKKEESRLPQKIVTYGMNWKIMVPAVCLLLTIIYFGRRNRYK